MTNTRGKTTTYEYDDAGQLVTVTDPLSRDTTYGYDYDGRLTSRLDGNGATTAYGYDALDRLTSIDYPIGTPDVTFTYDELGHRLTRVDGTGTTTYTYDALYRRTEIEDGDLNIVGYDYDAAGRLVEIIYPGGTDSVTYDYDAANRLTSVTDWLSNETTYTYDNANRLTSTTLGNGLISDRTYDDADRLLSVTNRDGGITLSEYEYTLDAVGNRLDMTDTSGTTEYTYDPLYRLTGVTYPNSDEDVYAYDAMGNRLTKTHNGGAAIDYTYDDADQMTDVEGTSYDYDDNGNQVAAGSDTFEWDHENRLIETNIASTTGTYAYNGDGLRITRTIGANAVSYVWDLNASLPVVLQDTEGNRYVYGLDLLTRIDGTDEEWYLYDGLGSTTGLADDTGTVTGAYEYDVFGAERAHTGDATEWSYTGEQHDATGLEYLRARYYDAGTGRFLARDALPLLQRYPYVAGNPASFVDPLGLCGFSLSVDNAKDCGKKTIDGGKKILDGGGECLFKGNPADVGFCIGTKALQSPLGDWAASKICPEYSYADLNAMFQIPGVPVVVTGGVQCNKRQGFHPYRGAGVGTGAAISLSVAPNQEITTGGFCGAGAVTGAPSPVQVGGQAGAGGFPNQFEEFGEVSTTYYFKAGAALAVTCGDID